MPEYQGNSFVGRPIASPCGAVGSVTAVSGVSGVVDFAWIPRSSRLGFRNELPLVPSVKVSKPSAGPGHPQANFLALTYHAMWAIIAMVIHIVRGGYHEDDTDDIG
jgi:hypothetical protein